MDPKAALDWAEEALRDGDRVEARERLADYRSWRARGGFGSKALDARAARLQQRLTMKKGTLKGSFGADAANRRRFSKVQAGSPVTRSVKRACAIVQSGPKKGKLRKGCRLTKSGARCDVLVRLPDTARSRGVVVSCK